PLREVPGDRPAASKAGAPRALRRRPREPRAGARSAAGDPSRVCSLLDGVQHPRPMRIPDRLHDDPDAAGQAGGLRGPRRPRPRRLALKRAGIVGAGSLLLALGPRAGAHSLLLESAPAADAQLVSSPSEISLRFNNRI